MINIIYKSAFTVADSSKGNPITSTLLVMLFFLMFNVFEAGVETVFFGDPFQHWLDPIFSLCFIAYAAFCVCACAVYNSKKSDSNA